MYIQTDMYSKVSLVKYSIFLVCKLSVNSLFLSHLLPNALILLAKNGMKKVVRETVDSVYLHLEK